MALPTEVTGALTTMFKGIIVMLIVQAICLYIAKMPKQIAMLAGALAGGIALYIGFR